MSDVTDKVERAIARFDRVTQQLDQRDGPAQEAARRERQRLNAGLGRTLLTVAIAVALIWVAAGVIGFIKPIGVIGFFLALLASAVVAAGLLGRGGRKTISAPAPSADLPNGAMVDRFDSYLYRARRALPPPAQQQLDAISAVLPSLKQTLERVDTLDPRAQDARRLMSIHLPGLLDRYANVPTSYRSGKDGEGKTVDERLVESLAAARSALGEVSEQLARQDMAAFETQGRFIKSRYGDDAELAGSTGARGPGKPPSEDASST